MSIRITYNQTLGSVADGAVRYNGIDLCLTMATPLKAEFDYYRAHQAELVKKFSGKFVVIKDSAVLGSYNSQLEAIDETKKTHELGTFLVQKCESGTESTTQSFHSRVAFA